MIMIMRMKRNEGVDAKNDDDAFAVMEVERERAGRWTDESSHNLPSQASQSGRQQVQPVQSSPIQFDQ